MYAILLLLRYGSRRTSALDSLFIQRTECRMRIAQWCMMIISLQPKKKLICRLCRALISANYVSRRAHIFQEHLKTALFTCTACSRGFNYITRRRLKQHCKDEHGGRSVEIARNFTQRLSDVREYMQRCFGKEVFDERHQANVPVFVCGSERVTVR